MSRWLPYRWLAVALFLMWMAMAPQYSLGQVLLGIGVAAAGVWAIRALRITAPRMRRPLAMLRLFGWVSVDIVRSNLAVASIILRPWMRPRSRFLDIKMELREQHALAVLACIVTATPGTIWVRYEPKSGMLLIHVLDLLDEAAWIEILKGRYERLLMEIFE